MSWRCRRNGCDRRQPCASIVVVGLLALSPTLAGCGGGSGSSPATKTAIPHITIDWRVRSRDVVAPETALSAVVTLRGAAVGGGDLTLTADRGTSTATAFSQTYAASAPAVLGSYAMNVVFYANADGAGSVVAQGAAQAVVGSTGLLPDVSPVGTIATVSIAAGQSVLIGQTEDLVVTAAAGNGTVIAVTPGSIFLDINAGGTLLQNVNGGATIQGLQPGPATVTATIDGISSPATPVTVSSTTVLNLSPAGPVTLSIGQTLPITAVFTDTPTGDTGITWSVLEGAAGGSVTRSGVYSAPNTAGTYHVVATSQYDPGVQKELTIIVQSGGLNVGVGFPASGGLNATVN